jgi:hypothetical protein
MYQIQTKQGGTFTPTITCCELWKPLPEEEWTVFEEAQTKIIEVASEGQLTNKDTKAIIAEHFPGWTLLSWWNPNLNNEGEF